MIIETVYNTGDTFYFIKEVAKSEPIDCKYCNNTRSVKIKGTTFECPNCATATYIGDGGACKHKTTITYEIGSFSLLNANILTRENKDPIVVWSIDSTFDHQISIIEQHIDEYFEKKKLFDSKYDAERYLETTKKELSIIHL